MDAFLNEYEPFDISKNDVSIRKIFLLIIIFCKKPAIIEKIIIYPPMYNNERNEFKMHLSKNCLSLYFFDVFSCLHKVIM